MRGWLVLLLIGWMLVRLGLYVPAVEIENDFSGDGAP